MTYRKQNKRSSIHKKRAPGRGGQRTPPGGPSSSGRPSFLGEDEILGFLHANNGEASLNEIVAGCVLANRHRKGLITALEDLCNRNLLERQDRNHYTLNKSETFLEGTISVHPRGFAFVTALSPDTGGAAAGQDVFIPPPALSSARHGDRVLIRISKAKGDRLEGRVIRVMERFTSRLVGIFMAGRNQGLVTPEDDRFAFNILIRKEYSCGARNGDAVVAEIVSYKEGRQNPEGRIIKVLGDPDDLGVQTDLVIYKYELPSEFSEKALSETRKMNSRVEPGDGRQDFRNITHVTIDGETARDFDDAVSVSKTEDGYRLYVSIADVSHYVTPGTALDQEAYQRGTSVYFPTAVVPMLPEKLSNDLCSLVPDQDRPTFSAVLDFDFDGNLRNKSFTKSIIRSRYRMTYTAVSQILIDQDAKVRQQYTPILTMLGWMDELARLLEKRRSQRGSIGFDLPEAEIVISDDGKIKDIARRERNQAHKIIEEFMLAANEAVAETFANGKKSAEAPFLYRIHETPDPIKVADFIKFARTMGLQLPEGEAEPRWFGKILALVVGLPQEYIISNLLLRTMKQARYSSNNAGHFGLAATYYTHFTSPIRRYPDLLVHRALYRLIEPARPADKKIKPQAAPDTEAGDFLSKRERVAVDAEREMVDRLRVRFMADKVGERFSGIISGATSFGLFIEILDTFVSGAVALSDLTDDYYSFDEQMHRLVGRRTGNLFQIGDLVEVRLQSVEVSRRRINFDDLVKKAPPGQTAPRR